MSAVLNQGELWYWMRINFSRLFFLQ